jgi:hypothetical protein
LKTLTYNCLWLDVKSAHKISVKKRKCLDWINFAPFLLV